MDKERVDVSNVVELFAGCGGMAIGLGNAGFRHDLLVEWNKDAAHTVAHNIRRGISSVHGWDYLCSDVRAVNWKLREGVTMVAGGPPCQPFSMGGKAAGHMDIRDMWPEAIRSIREMRPEAFLFENVKGLLRTAFADYVNIIMASLSRPSAERHQGESLRAFALRLEGMPTEYELRRFLVNAADYGAGQKRYRVIFAAFRKDLGISPVLPEPTHSEARLLWEQWVTGSYWEGHGLVKPAASPRVIKAMEHMDMPEKLSWRTCRDVFVNLGEPGGNSSFSNHYLQSGAKVYPGHTGSPIDEPAKALKAGTHGVPGGENMLLYRDGRVRYFTVREAARLQGMPDDYEFPSAWSQSMRQLGNAVPTQLAEAFGHMMLGKLNSVHLAVDKHPVLA